MFRKNRYPIILIAVGFAAISGCIIGPQRLHSDMLDYNEALSESFQEQILLNLVRMRYGAPPEYLMVEGISTQYSMNHEAGVNGSLIESAGNVLGLSGLISLDERPTVSYAPTQRCATFNAQLRRPFPSEVLHYLIDDGYTKSQVLHLMVRQINNLQNAETICGPDPVDIKSFEQFRQVVESLQMLFDARQLELHHSTEWEKRSPAIDGAKMKTADLVTAKHRGFEYRSDDDGQHFTLSEEVSNLRLHLSPNLHLSTATISGHSLGNPHYAELWGTVASTLGLSNKKISYEVVMCEEGHFERLFDPEQQDEIQISTRSFHGLMRYLTPAVHMPEAHLHNGLIDPAATSCCMGYIPFQVRVCKQKPINAAIAVPYRGYWFYIDSHDHSSRDVFRMLHEVAMIQLSCENLPEKGPILTLPIGG